MSDKNIFSNKIFLYSVLIVVAVAVSITTVVKYSKPTDRTVFTNIKPASADDFVVEQDENGKYVLTRYVGKGGYVVMPEKLNLPEGADEFAVAVIGKGAFANSNIQGIKLSEAVVGIEEGAFENCEYLEVVIGGNAFSAIGDRAFRNCPSLAYVYFPICTEIGESAFENDEKIERFYFPVMLSFVGDNAFRNTSLTNIAGYDEGFAKEYCGKHGFQFAEFDSLDEKTQKAYEGYAVDLATLEESLQKEAWETSETQEKE